MIYGIIGEQNWKVVMALTVLIGRRWKWNGLVMEKLLLGYKGFVALPQLCVQQVHSPLKKKIVKN